MGPKARNLSLFYWVRGQPFDVWHTVEVSPDQTIRVLKELIVQNSCALSDCDAAALRIYKVPVDQPVLEDETLEHNLGRLSISVLGMPLRARQASNTFTPVPEDQLHLIIDAPDLDVSYWLRGASHENRSVVRVSNAGIVENLKNIIYDKEKDLAAISWSRLRLYKISWKNDELIKSLDATGVGQLIDGASLVRTVFDDVPFNATPCVVVEWLNESVSRNLQLNCLILGNDPCRSFSVISVKIAGTANVHDLKKLIKQEQANDFRDIDANNLDLHKVSLPTDGELDEKLRHLILDAPLDPLTKLWTFFAQMVEESIHILVNQHDNHLQVGEQEQDGVITALTESFRLATTLSQGFAPSKAAKSRQYFTIQSDTRRIFDCRCAGGCPVNTVAPPIQLFNEAFAYFSSKVFDPEYNVPDDFVLSTRAIMTQFAVINTKEEDRHHRLSPLLQTAIDYPLTSHTNPDGTGPDSVPTSSCGSLRACLIINEEKNEFGDGGSDPSTQAAFSFQRTFSQCGLCMKCCCPSFLIAHAGPYFMIMGGIITDKCIIQRLTDFLWVPVHSTLDIAQSRRIARVLYALRESIQRLKVWYETIKDVTPFDFLAPHMHRRFFPSPDTYRDRAGGLVKFTYQRGLKPNVTCVTYLAKTIEHSPQDIVVKFVTSYGEDAHNEMASLGFAPQLLYYGPINVTNDMPSYGELRMVVMEYVSGFTLEDALMRQRNVPRNIGDYLRKVVKSLHEAGYVFGDLRGPNVVITPEGKPTAAQLIDFDWAGQEGEAMYPDSISSSILWPEGVKGLGPILKKHDNVMLDLLVSRCSRYQPADPKGKRRAIDTPSGQSPSKKTAAGEEDMDVDNL